MASANFSRDVLEEKQTITDDFINFETVIETPYVDEEQKRDLKVKVTAVKKFIKEYQKIYNHCDWLKIGKKEKCGKRCKQFYCSTHRKYIGKGSKIPHPCLKCGV